MGIRLKGDPGVIRTPGLRISRQSLYPLSYGAKVNRENIAIIRRFVKSTEHVHQFHQPTLFELYRLDRAHLMTTVTPYALSVIKI